MPSLRDPACLLPLILAGAASAQSQRISGELAHDPALLGGDVEEVFFSPDGSRLLFLADQESAGAIHLYSAPADGSASPVRLSPSSLGSELSSIEHEFTPDGSRVVFWRYAARYVAPIDGSAPALDVLQGMEFVWMHELTPDGAQTLWIEGDQGPVNLYVGPTDASTSPTLLLAGLGYTGSLDVSPDGARVLLREEDCYPCVNYYISLPIDGSQAPVTLNPALPSVGQIVVSPDSSRLVFAGMTSATEMAVFAVPLDGSAAPTALTGPMLAGEIQLRLSPNGNRLVYALDAEVDDLGEVYSVPINASAAPVKLSGALVPGGSVRAVDAGAPFEIAPDGLRVVYRADQQVLGQFELFKVPIVGGSATKLSGALVSGGDVHEFRIGPDSVGVIYRADALADSLDELFAVPFSGGAVRVSKPGTAGGDVLEFDISPDSAHIAYRGDLEVDARMELYRVAITGGASSKLNGTLATNGDVGASWALSSDSSRVAYAADELTDELVEAFSAPITGAPSVHVNDPLTPGPASGDVTTFATLPGSSGAVYIADGDVEDVFELYRTDLVGGPATKLSGALVAGGDVLELSVTADGARVLYRADAAHDGRNDLYSVAADGSQPPVRLNLPLLAQQDVYFPKSTPDGSRAVFFVYAGGNGFLYSAAIDGSVVQQLSPTAHGPSLWVDLRFQLSPDGSRVVYRTFDHIYSVPTDGSQPAVRLNGRFGPGSPSFPMSGPSFLVSPDGTRVVYLADANVSERYELFSVPIDGGGGLRDSVRLNGPLVPGGDVLEFDISADGARVVYYADQEVDDRLELYSAPILPGRFLASTLGPRRPWVKLNGPLAPGGRVGFGCCYQKAFRISPDGSRVAFSANPLVTGHHELFSVATAGGELVQLTSGNAFTSEIRFSPDGTRVVFAGKSTLVDGSQPPVFLYWPATGSSYSISPDGDWVVFRTTLEQAGRFDLYAIPIDGSLTPLRLNGPTIANGDVAGDNGTSTSPTMLVTSDSNHVVYGADQDTDEIFELHAGSLPNLP